MLANHEGTPIKNVAVRVVRTDGPVQRGDIVVTRTGLEGGPVYALSRGLRSAPSAALQIDLAPDLPPAALVERLQRRRKGATQTAWLRTAGLAPVAIALLRDATANSLPDDAEAMAALVKAVELPIDGLAALDRAISSSGGVSFDEIDEHFMLRSHPGVFVAGEMLDWEAPTGGYLLQACFSTGAAAARGAIAWHATTA